MTKSVSIPGSRSFGSIALAKEHFHAIRDSGDIDQPYVDDDAADVQALYAAYCAATNWQMPSEPVSFFPTYERKPGFTTRCIAVEFDNGSVQKFSIDKALTSIAK